AGRYLLMNEDVHAQVESSVANLQPAGVATPLRPEEFHPGDSLAAHFGKKCDAAIRERDEAFSKVDEAVRARDEAVRKVDEAVRARDETASELSKVQDKIRQNVARRRQRGHTDGEIADDLGYSLEEFLQRFPRQT